MDKPTSLYMGSILPPYTDRVTRMSATPMGKKVTDIVIFIFIAAAVAGIGWVARWLLEIGWLLYVGYVLAALLLLVGVVMSVRSQEAICPYCEEKLGGEIQLQTNDKNLQVECNHCHEWLMSNQGELRAFTEEDAASLDEFEAPVFKEGIWPDECIVCGKPREHGEKAADTKLSLGSLLVGTLSISTLSIDNIPYCADHTEAVELSRTGDQLRIVFNDYKARRRYLSLNKGKKPATME